MRKRGRKAVSSEQQWVPDTQVVAPTRGQLEMMHGKHGVGFKYYHIFGIRGQRTALCLLY